MLRIFSFLVLFITFISSSFAGNGIFDGKDTEIKYGGDNYSLEKGIESVKGVDDIMTEGTASAYVQNVVGYILTFLGIVAILMIIYAGFNLLTSGGDDEKVSSSKKTILFALIGLVLIYLAGPIVTWMINVLNATN